MTQEPVSALLPELVEELLLGGTCVRLEVGGVSMAPRLRDHDHVIVRPLNGDDACFGDLLLYRNTAGALILHRLVRRWRDNHGRRRLQTRGDTNLRLDVSIDAERVLGRVCRIERIGLRQIDLETAGERVRAVIVAAGKLLCSAVYYKLGRAGSQNKIAEAPSSQQ
jgi:hypothetical protein